MTQSRSKNRLMPRWTHYLIRNPQLGVNRNRFGRRPKVRRQSPETRYLRQIRAYLACRAQTFLHKVVISMSKLGPPKFNFSHVLFAAGRFVGRHFLFHDASPDSHGNGRRLTTCLFRTAAYCSNSSSPARLVALTTALMSVTRSFPSSSSRMPSMVQPAGVVTASLSSAG
jgi:hypothetical protein